MTNWKSRSYSKHSDSAGKALKELSGSKPLRNQNLSGNGFGNSQRENDNTDRKSDTLQGRTVINK